MDQLNRIHLKTVVVSTMKTECITREYTSSGLHRSGYQDRIRHARYLFIGEEPMEDEGRGRDGESLQMG